MGSLLGKLLVRFGVAAVAVAALTPRPAAACSVCGCGDPLVLASDGTPRGTWLRLALEFEYLSARARSDDQPDLTESLTQLTLRPVVVVSPVSSLNLVVQVPFVYKDWSLGAAGQTAAAARPVGVGDLDLGLRWFLVDHVSFHHRSRQSFALSAGSSLPTGNDDVEKGGVRIDDHAQLGTGAFAPYGGLLYAYHRDPANVFVSATYRTHTANSYGYRFGDAVLGSVRFEYRRWERLALGLGVDGRWAAHDVADGARQVNTGGLLVAVTPGVTVNVWDSVWLLLRVQVPAATRLYGEQHFGPTVTATVQYTLEGL